VVEKHCSSRQYESQQRGKEGRNESRPRKMDANQARIEEITANIEDSLKEEIRLTVSALGDKMEAIVHSIPSELDGKIQH
jgi:hypothetical protein